MKWKERYANELRGTFSEVYSLYGMCDPRWSPEISLRDHMVPGTFDVSYQSVQYCIRSLRYRGVPNVGMTSFDDVIANMNLSTSAGFGFTDTVAHKSGLVLSYDGDIMKGYQEWYESLPDGVFTMDSVRDKLNPSFITAIKVKEEVSKILKIQEGNYRTFFCVPFDQIVLSKCEQTEFNEALTRCGFLFKGEDPRAAIRTLCHDCLDDDYVTWQGDAKKLDRSISRKLIERCFEIRSAFGATATPGMKFASTHPVVSYVGEDGKMYLAKFERPQTSGRDSTTEDDLLVIYLIICEVLSAFRVPYHDIFFTGVGDDWTLMLPRKWTFLEEKIFDEFPKHGITMKSWRVSSHEDFHFLGADILETSDGLQPVWDLDRSVVRLSYRSKKESNFVYAMRIAGVYAYNVFHPKALSLLTFLRWYVANHYLKPSERMIVLDSIRSARDYYWLLQRESGGPNLDRVRMAKSKGNKKKAKAQRPAPRKKNQVKVGGMQRSTIPAWLNAVRNPWRHGPTSIPDEMCQPSLKYESRYSNAIVAQDLGASPSTSHGLLVGVGPYLFNSNGVAGCGAVATRGYDNSTNSYSGDISVASMPNQSAMFPPVTIGSATTSTGYTYRVTAMSAKLTYMGTELNRAGRIVAGLAATDESGTALVASSRPANPLSMVYASGVTAPPTQAIQSVRNRLRRITTIRNPDGSVEVRWLPSGVPRYASMIQTTASAVNEYSDLGPCIIFAVENDQTAAAAANGNQYQLDVVMHTEVIPLSRYALAVGPSPSPYDPAALAICLNSFEQMSAVSEWDDGGHHFVDDGGQRDVGSAWEFVNSVGSSVLGSARQALNMTGSAARDPLVQGLARLALSGSRRGAGRRYAAINVD